MGTVRPDSQPGDRSLQAHVCVIGAGPAGITVARELARHAGLRVLLVDSGGTGLQRAAQRLADGEVAAQPYPPLARTRGRGLGGTSLRWPREALRCRPLDPLDFASRPEIDRPGWPFGSEELAPYYRRAAEVCGLPDASFASEDWQDGNGRPPLHDERVREAVFLFAPPDRFRADLAAEVAGNEQITVALDTTVTQLRLQPDGMAVGAVHARTAAGDSVVIEADQVVLAAGGIDNARLLLASRTDHPHGLGNGADLVGRYFMEHPHVASGVVRGGRLLDVIDHFRKQSRGGSRVLTTLAPTDDLLRSEAALGSCWKLDPAAAVEATPAARGLRGLAQSVRHRRWPPPEGTAARAAAVLRRPDHAAAALWRERRPGRPELVTLFAMAEQQPNPASRVTLADRADRFGVPLPRLEWRLTDLDFHSLRAGQRLVGAALEAAGLGRLTESLGSERPAVHLGGGLHHMGTTRMAASPRRGVVDADCRVHGIPNLYVAGSSVFPTSGFANPTYTIVALALRLADHVLAGQRAVSSLR